MRVPDDGGVPARRAVVRWAWRQFRREWRQQLLVIVLLTGGVATAILSVSAAYNIAPSRDARFGTADHHLTFGVPDPAALEEYLPAAEEWFGTIEVIGRRQVPIPGSLETVELRAQDPDGAYGAPMLRLREGRYPVTDSEVALTDGVRTTFMVGVGDAVDLEGTTRSVVGVVENPGDLHDEFALVTLAHDAAPEEITVLVAGSIERVRSFPEELDPGPGSFESRAQRVGGIEVAEAPKATVALLGLIVATVGLLLVCLIAAAGFVVVAQRRLRQLGVLAAIGASARSLRLVMVANGAVVGVLAALIGATLAFVAWVAIGPLLEEAAGHRIDRFGVPWWLIGAGMTLAVVTATAAAWWPARIVAKVPITSALSARPNPLRPEAARGTTAFIAGALALAGVTGLATGIDLTQEQANPLLVVASLVALVSAVVLISSPALGALGAIGARLPIAARVALRDLARYRSRSGATLAAVSLGLGIAVLFILVATAAEHGQEEGNLSDRQLLIRIGDVDPLLIPELASADSEELRSRIDEFAATLDDPAVIPLYAAVNPTDGEARTAHAMHPMAVLGRLMGETVRTEAILYVATPDLLAHLEIDPNALAADVDVVTPHTGELRYANATDRRDDTVAGCGRSCVPLKTQTLDMSAYTSAPTSIITTEGLRRTSWEPALAGWFLEMNRPLTRDEIATARQFAATDGMTIESRDTQNELPAIRTGATAVGLLLAMAILAMTVALLRSESARDLRTLTATGATSMTRRNITATTAGALALLGALLGTAAAYLGLTGAYYPDTSDLGRVPAIHLLFVVVGVPCVAFIAAWLLSGRHTPLTRHPIE